MQASDKSDSSPSDPFYDKMKTNKFCLMDLVLFAIYVNLVLENAFCDYSNEVLFEIITTGRILVPKDLRQI